MCSNVVKQIVLGMVFSLYALSVYTNAMKPSHISPAAGQSISVEQFKRYKNGLPSQLRGFIDDFATWSSEDKQKIAIRGLFFDVNGLSHQKRARYGGDIEHWINCRADKRSRTGVAACLRYLQQHDQ